MNAMVFVESNTTGTGRLFIQAARARGFDFLLLSSGPSRYLFVEQDQVPAVTTDTTEVSRIYEELEKFGPESLKGVISSSEYFIGTAALVARKFGLPAADPDAILRCRDKYLQRLNLGEAGLATPNFWRVASEADIQRLIEELHFPIIVKPASGTGSVGVKLCATRDEVLAHTRLLLTMDRNERGIPVEPVVLIEEYVDGPEFSAEMFSGHLLGITRKYLSTAPYFIETGHDFPAPLAVGVERSVAETMKTALDALGLGWGHCHIEFRVVADRPIVIEVNPRLAGGNIPKLVHLSTGIDPIDLSIRLHSGQGVDLRPTCSRAASIRFFILPRGGRYLRLDGVPTAESSAGVTEVQAYVRKATEMKIHHDFRDRVGHVIATGGTTDAAATNVEEAAQQVHVVMDSPSTTGRIQIPLHPAASKMLFQDSYAHQLEHDLPMVVEVDRAHIVMLAEQRIVAHWKASRLLSELEELKRVEFEPLHGRSAPRGLFLAYESYLIDKLGTEVGGILQTARSRNDLNATVFRLNLRKPWASVVESVAGLDAIILRQALRYRGTVMPIYTHGQAGVPGTLGHYLAGVACGVERDLRSVLESSDDIRRCPLGAGAAGGSTIPIDVARTASLLGFEYPVNHSIDAVASRDLALRLLGSLAIFGVTLSRLAVDILQWSTAEFDLIELPDDLVGSSSAMPQKKNPFLAEHIIGMSAAPIGAFIQATAAMRCAPYTNAIQVGTEALRPLADALLSIERAAVLTRLMIAGCTSQPPDHAGSCHERVYHGP